jgi:hypothetical protein
MSDDNQKDFEKDEIFGNIRTMEKDVHKILGVDTDKVHTETKLKSRIKEEMQKQEDVQQGKSEEVDLFAVDKSSTEGVAKKVNFGEDVNSEVKTKKAKRGWLSFGKKEKQGAEMDLGSKTDSIEPEKSLFKEVEESIKSKAKDFSESKLGAFDANTSATGLNADTFFEGDFNSSKKDIDQVKQEEAVVALDANVDNEKFTRLGKDQSQDFSLLKKDTASLGVDLNIEESEQDTNKDKRYSTVDHKAESKTGHRSNSKMFMQLGVITLVIGLGVGMWFLYPKVTFIQDILNKVDGVLTFDLLTQEPTYTQNINNTPNKNSEPSEQDKTPAGGITLQADKSLKVSVTQGGGIRQEMQKVLEQEVDKPFVEIVLTDSLGDKISLNDFTTRMGITIYPDIVSMVSDYTVYGYLLEDMPKLGLMLELKRNLAETYVDLWVDRVVSDLSGFSLKTDNRLQSTGLMKSIEIDQKALGRSIRNYYYNYSGLGDNSVDITAYNQYVLIANSKDAMRFLLAQMILR